MSGMHIELYLTQSASDIAASAILFAVSVC